MKPPLTYFEFETNPAIWSFKKRHHLYSLFTLLLGPLMVFLVVGMSSLYAQDACDINKGWWKAKYLELNNGIKNGDTVHFKSCQVPWSISASDLKYYEFLKESICGNRKLVKQVEPVKRKSSGFLLNGLNGSNRSYGYYGPCVEIKTFCYKVDLPENAPEGMYQLWKYEYVIEDVYCQRTYKTTFYVGLYDHDGPIYQDFPKDTSIAVGSDIPDLEKKVRIVDVCQYVVWDTIIIIPILNDDSATIGYARRWMARDPSGNESSRDQKIWFDSVDEAPSPLDKQSVVGRSTVVTKNPSVSEDLEKVIVVINNSVARCKDITVYLDRNGKARISPSDVDNGSTTGSPLPPIMNVSSDLMNMPYNMLSLSQYRFDCGDVGENIVKLSVNGYYPTYYKDNRSSCEATVTVKDYKPTFKHKKEIENGDTVHLNSCQVPWGISQFDMEDIEDIKKHGTISTFVYKDEVPEDAPEGMYQLWRYEYTVKDGCYHTYKFTYYLGLYDHDGPIYQDFPNDTSIAVGSDIPALEKEVKIIDVCQYVVWDTIILIPILGDDSLTIGYTRRWMAGDPSGNESSRDQKIWFDLSDDEVSSELRSVVSPNTVQEGEWKVFPNPARNMVYVDLNTEESLEYNVFDALGRSVKRGDYHKGQPILLDQLEVGVYHIQLRDQKEILGAKKVLIVE